MKQFPCAITLTAHGYEMLPQTLKRHVDAGGSLYQVEPDLNGHAFVSPSQDITGRLCTVLASQDIVVPDTAL